MVARKREYGARHLPSLPESVCFAPVIFQEYVQGTDLRITIVGDEIFPAAIHVAPTGYQVDFRMTMDEARIEAVALPDDLSHRLRSFMRRLGLDVRLTPESEYVFFEINPSGQWLFIEQATGQPITGRWRGCWREDGILAGPATGNVDSAVLIAGSARR